MFTTKTISGCSEWEGKRLEFSRVWQYYLCALKNLLYMHHCKWQVQIIEPINEAYVLCY